jgi:hypothetical protein
MKVEMKSINKVPLKIGYLTFLKDRLEISDNSRIEKISILTGFFISSFYGLWCVLSYNSNDHPLVYYSGIMILITWALATPFLISRTYKHVLYYREIGKINMKKNTGGDFKAMIKLKRGGTRFVHLDRNTKNFKLFINQLKANQLKTESQSISA